MQLFSLSFADRTLTAATEQACVAIPYRVAVPVLPENVARYSFFLFD
jgi:hypothetical protein